MNRWSLPQRMKNFLPSWTASYPVIEDNCVSVGSLRRNISLHACRDSPYYSRGSRLSYKDYNQSSNLFSIFPCPRIVETTFYMCISILDKDSQLIPSSWMKISANCSEVEEDSRDRDLESTCHVLSRRWAFQTYVDSVRTRIYKLPVEQVQRKTV